MKKFILVALATIMAGGGALVMPDVAAARTHHSGGVHQRQVHQQKRIYRGIRRGSLTFREARRLGRMQSRIHAKKSRYLSDGSLSRRERRNLHHSLSRSSRNIYSFKHNRRHH